MGYKNRKISIMHGSDVKEVRANDFDDFLHIYDKYVDCYPYHLVSSIQSPTDVYCFDTEEDIVHFIRGMVDEGKYIICMNKFGIIMKFDKDRNRYSVVGYTNLKNMVFPDFEDYPN